MGPPFISFENEVAIKLQSQRVKSLKSFLRLLSIKKAEKAGKKPETAGKAPKSQASANKGDPFPPGGGWSVWGTFP